ncbi:MAG TPA: lipid II flippase MurJ [Pyrinomonadaceae bacterium]|nr:lipid II flippase MurJ [Pyrinomonadaceae bacterium]
MKQTVTLAGLAVTNILLTLLLQWYVVTELGVGAETDALFASMAVPQLILSIVSTSLTHVLVPLLTTQGENTFQENAWTFLLSIAGLFAILALIFGAGASYWVPWLFPGFDRAGQELAVRLTRIQLTGVVLTASVAVLWSVSYAREKFIWVELSPVLAGAAALLVMSRTLPQFGIVAAAWAIVLRTALQVVMLLPALGWPRPRWRSPAIKEAWRRLRPLLLGASYYRTDSLVDRYLSSLTGTGGLSLFYISQQIYGVANYVLEKAIAAPMVPLLAQKASAGDWASFRAAFHRRLFWMGLLTIAGYGLFILIGESALTLLIGRGGVTRGNVHTLWILMIALAGFLIGGAMGQITSSTFYAMGDTQTPTRLSVINYTVYIPFKFVAFMRYGLIGLAVVTTLYYFVNLLVQIVLLERLNLRKMHMHSMREGMI